MSYDINIMNINPGQRYRIRAMYSRKHSQGYHSCLLELYSGNDFYRVEIKGSAPYQVRLLDPYDRLIVKSNNTFNASQIIDTSGNLLFSCKIGIKEFFMSSIAVTWSDERLRVIRPTDNRYASKAIEVIPDELYIHINRDGFIAEIAKSSDFNAACVLASIFWRYQLNANMD